MKKTMFALLGAGLLMAAPACKKGENDPALSLKSRKGRLTAEWTVSSYMDNSMNTSNYNDDTNSDGDLIKSVGDYTMNYENGVYSSTSKNTNTYDGQDASELTSSTSETERAGTKITQTYTSVAGGTTTTNTNTGDYTSEGSWTISFEKDGTFKMDKVMSTTETFTDVETGYTEVETEKETETTAITGTWSFIGKNKADEYKKKERINLWYGTSTTTVVTENTTVTTDTDSDDLFDYASTSSSSSTETMSGTSDDSTPDETWELDMLKGKEVTAMRSYNTTRTSETVSSYTSGSTTVSSTTNSSGDSNGTTTMNLVRADQ
jgi:hypothetical protein